MTKKQTVAYLSGPITGVKDYEERFAEAYAKAINDPRIDAVISPIDIGSVLECDREKAGLDSPKWRDFVIEDITVMMRCDVVVMLPDWIHSSGARIERGLAQQLSIKVWELSHLRTA